jgi:tetratricopeptide (TPR) repeat protein
MLSRSVETQPTHAPDASEALLTMGLDRHRAGDLAGAEARFRQAIAEHPDDPTAHYLLGLIRFEAGDAAEAEQLMARVTAMRPQNPQAWLTLATLRQARGDDAGAARAYAEAARLAPADAAALIGLAQARLAGGDAAAALAAAEAAVAAARDDSAAHLALAAALAALQRPADAARAYRRAVTLTPQSAAAHLGLAVELLQSDDPDGALAAAEQAVALDATTALGWFTLGTALRRIGRIAEAMAALERAVALAPDRRAAVLSLGLLRAEFGPAPLARRWLARAIELSPDDAEAHAALSTVCCSLDDLEGGRIHAERALALDPAMLTAHQNLARIAARQGREAEARQHRDLAYGVRNFVLAEAPRAIQRVLVPATTDLGNTPDRHLLPADRYTRIFWFAEYAGESQMKALPDFDVVFNGIGDADETGRTEANVARFLSTCRRPVFNPPDKVARTFRHLAPALFAGIDGLVVPAAARLAAGTLAELGLGEAARRAGVTPPLIVRPVGTHGGEGAQLVTAASIGAVEIAAGRDHYVTAFHDVSAADGLYRKYRTIFVDRTPYPYHLAIGPRWLVHYETSGTVQHPERLDEERRFLADPEAALGRRAMDAVRAVGERLDLDFAGADFSLLPDGRVLLFEANATMLVHPEDADGPLAHKNPHVERILAAFRVMLRRSHPVDESR